VLAFCLSLLCCPLFTAVLVRWLGSSFAFFCLAFALAQNANVLPNALALHFTY